MGLEIKITGSDGRRYQSMADMFEAEGRQLIDDKIAAVKRAIASQRCAVHGERPSVNVRQSGDETQFEISACCEGLRDQAQRAADSAFRG